MKLKEIEMDLPYVEDEKRVLQIQRDEELNYQKAVIRDYELNWKGIRRKFQLMTRCMTSMIERVMQSIDTRDCWKLLFECVDEKKENRVKNLLGVYTFQIEFDIKGFFLIDDDEKKKVIIKAVMNGVEGLEDKVGFDLTSIRNACLKIIDCHYVNEWMWKKPVKIREKYVQIKLQHNVNNVNIYMVFFDRQKNFAYQTLLISTLPDERDYSAYLGKIEQISDSEVALITKTGKKFVEMIGE